MAHIVRDLGGHRMTLVVAFRCGQSVPEGRCRYHNVVWLQLPFQLGFVCRYPEGMGAGAVRPDRILPDLIPQFQREQEKRMEGLRYDQDSDRMVEDTMQVIRGAIGRYGQRGQMRCIYIWLGITRFHLKVQDQVSNSARKRRYRFKNRSFEQLRRFRVADEMYHHSKPVDAWPSNMLIVSLSYLGPQVNLNHVQEQSPGRMTVSKPSQRGLSS